VVAVFINLIDEAIPLVIIFGGRTHYIDAMKRLPEPPVFLRDFQES
jgi:hypothetical protein